MCSFPPRPSCGARAGLVQALLGPPGGLAWGLLGQSSWSASPACEAGDSVLSPTLPRDHVSSAHLPPLFIKGGDTGAELGLPLLAKQPWPGISPIHHSVQGSVLLAFGPQFAHLSTSEGGLKN